jgi:hypothetical protein
MGLKIENAEDLAQLLANVEHDFDQLQGLLVKLKDKDPAVAKEELAQEERVRNEELARKERLRNLVHAERIKALEMGHTPADSGEVVRTGSVVRGATSIAILVPLVLACAASGVSALILLFVRSSGEVLFFDVRTDLLATLFAIVWGVCGGLTLFTVFACLRLVRLAREWSPALEHRPPARQSRLNSEQAV